MTRLFRHPSEPSGEDSEVETTINEDEAPAKDTYDLKPEGLFDPQELQAELAAVKKERDENLDRLLRKAAEFDNYRKRTEKEKIESAMLAKSAVLTEILPIVDGFERALESLSETDDASPELAQYKEGVQLLYKQFKDVLTRLGVTAMEAKGKEFDPHLHEALVREETSDYEENTVIEVLQPGYFFKDRLLRPAQVKVAISPKSKEAKPASKNQ